MASPEVADIFRQYGPSYRSTHKLPLDHVRAMHAIEVCRTAELGGHIDECEECGHVKISYNSCRNRHCPKCQSMRREKWIAARRRELLPVPYFHVVFTLPDELNVLVRHRSRCVYTILFRAASETLIEVAQSRLGVKIGFITVLHTWGSNLMDHPHLHCIVSGGGLAGERWVSSRRRFLFPVKVLSRLFRGKFLALSQKARDSGDFSADKDSFRSLMKKLYEKEWVVYAKSPFHGPETVLEYLGRYAHRVAITNRRIIDITGGKVSFIWKDYAGGNTQKVMALEPSEFIRRFLLHILPHGFVKIRHFGFLSNRCRKASLDVCRSLLDATEPPATLPETWQQSLLRLTGIDVTRCPVCEGRMVRKAWDRGPP
jgi:hypothetical protein